MLHTYNVDEFYTYLSNDNICQPVLYQAYDKIFKYLRGPMGDILDNRTEKLAGIAYGFAAAFTNYCVFEYYFRFKGFLHPDFFKAFPNECLVDPQQLIFETNLQEAFTTYFTHQINELEKELSKHDVDYFSLESDEDKHYYLIAQLLHLELSYRNQNEALYAVIKNADALRKHVDEFLKFLYTKLQKAEGFNDIKSEYQALFSKTKAKEQKACIDIPKENHYADTARWIEKHKSERDYMREANNNIEELARILSPIFGWVLEGHQLRKALNRR